MRILHVISNLEVGGAEKMVVTIANASVNTGHTVGVCLLVNRGPLVSELDKRVELHELNRQWRFDWKALKTFASLAKQYDLLHVHLKHNVKYVYVVNLLFGIPVPVLLHDHSAEVLVTGVPKTKLPFFVVWWLRKQHYLAVSEQLLHWAVVNFGLNPARATWLGNAIACKPVAEVKKEESDVIKILLVSNFRRIKNIEFAVELVAKMMKREMKVTLDIVGKPLDRAYYDEIKNTIQVRGLSDKIQIREDVSDISMIIPAYTLGIHCSKAETGPLVLLEFMCGGLPFVAYSSGDVSIDVIKKYPKLIAKEFDVNDWINRIRYLFLNLKKYHGELRTFVQMTYSHRRYNYRLNDIYKLILDAG
ncbi:MAG: glycosyltransferase [Cytophagales bacterium]|nr:glycosyltransferase [Cytophagales bacterium]